MQTKDWVHLIGTLANAYAKVKSQKNINNSNNDSAEQCDGIVHVSGYTRADGTEVAPYERICPYHYNGQKLQKKENEEKDKEKLFKLNGTVSATETTDENDVVKLKTNLYKMNYYKPNERSEPDGRLHKYINTELISAIKDFQRDNNLVITGRISAGDDTERVMNEILQQPYPYDKNFERSYNKLKEPEGGYTDGTDQINDEPTNKGIKQSTLSTYVAKHPNSKMPTDVYFLTDTQAKEIYRFEYWDNTKIPQIKNDRIRDAVFDMNVMGGAGTSAQNALRNFLDTNLVVDGIIGNNTIDALNSIPEIKISDFINTLKSSRIQYLQKTQNWSTSKNGWKKRVSQY